MLVVGGCELAHEKNPYSSIEEIKFDPDTKKLTLSEFLHPCLIPVRSPISYFDHAKRQLYILGGCRGPKDHIEDI